MGVDEERLREFLHDIRNPIGAIVGFADILKNKPDRISKDKQREVIEALDRTAQRLSGLVNDFIAERKLRRTGE